MPGKSKESNAPNCCCEISRVVAAKPIPKRTNKYDTESEVIVIIYMFIQLLPRYKSYTKIQDIMQIFIIDIILNCHIQKYYITFCVNTTCIGEYPKTYPGSI